MHCPRAAALTLVALALLAGCGDSAPTSPGASAPTASLSQITVTPASVTAGAQAQGEVTLTAPAASEYAVNLSSSAAAAGVPMSVRIAAGATSVLFVVSTQPVPSETAVTISATAAVETRTATLTIRPQAAPAVDRLQVDPSFEGGLTTQATVHLDAPASPNAIVVTLTSDNSALSVPSSVTVPAGTTAATFTVSSRTVSTDTRVTVSASAGGQTRTADIVVRPRTTPLPGAGTFFSYVSAPGDRVGLGKSATIRPSDATFTANTCGQRQYINIDVRYKSTEYWTLQFVAPQQGELRPGTYTSNGSRASGQPYFFVSGTGAPLGGNCGVEMGRFVVLEAEYLGSATIRRFHATFEQRCERPDAPPLTGEINLIDPPVAVGRVIC